MKITKYESVLICIDKIIMIFFMNIILVNKSFAIFSISVPATASQMLLVAARRSFTEDDIVLVLYFRLVLIKGVP